MNRFKYVVCLLFVFASLSSVAVLAKVSPEFSKKKIRIGKKEITVLIAESEAQHEYGLMFRKSLEPNSGMLFIFKSAEIRRFWMKNTFIPLSIGYFDKQKTLIDIQEMQAVQSEIEQPQIYTSNGFAQYALEMNKGWFRKNNIKVGEKFEFSK